MDNGKSLIIIMVETIVFLALFPVAKTIINGTSNLSTTEILLFNLTLLIVILSLLFSITRFFKKQ